MAEVIAHEQFSLQQEPGTDAERALVATVNRGMAEQMRALFDNGDAMVIDQRALNKAKPSSINKGAQLRCLMLRQFATNSKKTGDKILMLTVIVCSPLTENVIGLDKNAGGQSCVSNRGSEAALLRVDLRYPMTPADQAAIRAKNPKLPSKQEKGQVPCGVLPISAGQVLQISYYGAGALMQDGEPIRAGSLILLNGVTSTIDYEPGMSESAMVPTIRVRECQVVKCDDENGARLSEACLLSKHTPPLNNSEFSKMMLPEWPHDMLVPEDELPASEAPSNGRAITDGPKTSNLLEIPKEPRIFTIRTAPFIAHIGESREQAIARASTMSPGTGSVPTRFWRPVPSVDTDAFVYLDNNKEEHVHARFVLLCQQTVGYRTDTAAIFVTIPTGPAIEMITAIPGIEAQKAVIRAIVAGLTGPLGIEPRPAATPEFTIEGLGEATIYSSYIGAISPSLLQSTIPVAGFRVSEEFMMIERAMGASNEARSKVNKPSEYYKVAGPPSPHSPVLMLNFTQYGFFDDASNNLCRDKMATLKTVDEKRAAARDLLPKLTGGLKELSGTHAFYVVGRFSVTAGVIAHQKEKAGTEELIRGNEHLMNTGKVPEGFPEEIYEEMIEHSVRVGTRYGHYAVPLKLVDESASVQRIKNLLEPPRVSTKTRAIEGRAVSVSFPED